MEERKNHPSLPSNYVTLAQLQERWVQQQNQINQPQPQPQHQHQHQEQKQQPPKENHQQRQDQHVVAPTNGTDSRSRPLKQQYVVKNRNDSGTQRRAVQVASDDRRKSAPAAGIGDEAAYLDGKVSQSKKKKKHRKVKWKPKTKKRGASGESSVATAQGNEEAEKAPLESELKEKKHSKVKRKPKTEERGASGENSVAAAQGNKEAEKAPFESELKEKKHRKVKRKPKTGERGASEESSVAAAQGNGEAEKAPIESELKEKKNGGSVTEVEQRVRVLSVEQRERVRVLSNNSGNGKQNGKLGKMNNSFRHSQYPRMYYGEASYGNMNNGFRHSQYQRWYYGEASYGNGRYSKVGAQRAEKKMVWVKKDEIDGEIKT